MPTITPTTELEAVNAILASIGEAPVESLDGSFTDAELAQDLLRQESRGVQVQGFTFNTERQVTLTPDNSGNINLPQNTLRFIYADDRSIVQRGFRLYDATNHTYAFENDVTCDLVVGLDYDELPEALRRFLFFRAGRIFQDRMGGDRVLHQFSANDEMGAWAAFLNYEAEVGGYNVFNPETNTLIARLKGNR